MKAKKQPGSLERQIENIKRQLLALGPLHPGTLSRQYQVCGNPTCRCMRSRHPQRHGPYSKLVYARHGKQVCRFVRAACVPALEKRVATYKKFKTLIDAWIDLSLQQGAILFFASPDKKPLRCPRI
jgi:hypothetical protein